MAGIKCPRDGGATDEVQERVNGGEITIDLCPDCAGVWLDGGELMSISGAKNVEVFLAGKKSRPSTMRCPRDNSPMDLKEFSGVEIDVCVLCNGVWLDPSELEALQLSYLDHLDQMRDLELGEVRIEVKRPGTGSVVAWALRQEK